MTASKTVNLACDARPDDKRCWTRYESWQRTNAEARRVARADGWTHDKVGHDFCPEHPVSVARGTVEA